MRDNERGFALPMVIFLSAIITVMLMAAHTKVNADRRVGEATGANVNALALAKAALQRYLVTKTTRPADGDSVRINVTGGYGDVIAKVIRRPADTLANWVFIVRAVGHVIDPTQGADPQAVRTIAQWAQWQTGRMDTRAAYVAVDGLTEKSGATDSIRGADSTGCGAATTYGVMTKSGGGIAPSVTSPNSITGIGSAPSIYNSWAPNTVVDSTNLDWAGILNGGFIPDHTTVPTVSDNTYTSWFVNGSATLGNIDGTGILIVKNDLTITGTGTTRWKGIILVGGKITFNAGFKPALAPWTGGTKIQGMVAAGLNQGGSKGDIGDYPLVVQYNSCRIREALAKLTGFAPITNGWVDNWATY